MGFSLVGGINGSSLQIKDICCGGVAEQDGRLRVGDILLEVVHNEKFLCSFTFVMFSQVNRAEALNPEALCVQVNGVIVSGLSHLKVVDILRRAEGTVQLTVYRDTFPMTSCTGPRSSTENPQENNTKGLPLLHYLSL